MEIYKIILIFLLTLSIGFIFLGVAALLRGLASRTGNLIVNDNIILRDLSLENVPDPKYFAHFWKFTSVILNDPDTHEQFPRNAERLRAMIAQLNIRNEVKSAVCNAGAGALTMALAPEIYKNITGEEPSKSDASAIDRGWLERTIDNYEKIPSFMWRVIDSLLDGEWIISAGRNAGEFVFLITTRRMFIFEKQQLTHNIDVSTIKQFDVSFTVKNRAIRSVSELLNLEASSGDAIGWRLWLPEVSVGFSVLTVAVITWVFTVTGPLTLATAVGGKSIGDFYVSVIVAALSVFLIVPLFFGLILHSFFNAMLIAIGSRPSYTSGAFGAVKWLHQYGFYDPRRAWMAHV